MTERSARTVAGVIHGNPASRCAALLLVGVVAGAALTGCSADDAARGSLSQSAGTAAASARSAGLVLGLQQNGRMLGTVLDTGLSASSDNLAQEAQSVSSMTALGGIGRSRDRVLGDIRAAEDAVSSAQRAVAAGHDGRAALEPQRRRLDALAQRLDAASKRLEGE
ncbi:hypothetical protein [Leifsonia sp. SIMBA_070]|uniref:hypothetical protein n=1 Tax=Leifsonia sp. SIMBA_070 TaxID=3085810 RepID=UPI00397E3414